MDVQSSYLSELLTLECVRDLAVYWVDGHRVYVILSYCGYVSVDGRYDSVCRHEIPVQHS